MKKYTQFLAIAALLAVAPAAKAVDMRSINAVIQKVGGPEEAKKLANQAQAGAQKAQEEMKRISAEIKTLREKCPTSSLNPLNKQFKSSCLKDAVTLGKKEAQLAATRAKAAWDSKMAEQARALIQKKWPAFKAKFGTAQAA